MFLFCSKNENGEENDIPKEYTYQIKEEKITVMNGEIWGQIYLPDNLEKSAKTVILSHGFNGTYEFGIPYAEELSKKGYVVYIFDFINGSIISRSGTDTEKMSIFEQVRQLKDITEKISEKNYVDKANIYLAGHSQGGLVSALMAAENKDMIKGLILLAPGFAISDYVNQFFKSADDIPETSTFLNATVGKKYVEELLGFDVFKEIVKFDKKVLIIHGTEDEISPIEYSRKAVELYKNAQIIEIENGDHSFSKEGNQETVTNSVIEFLKNDK